VSGLVSEKMGCNENPFQTFGAIETIVSRGRGELRCLEDLMKTFGSGERAESREAPEALQ
jgi:hypothetical protein